MLLKRPGLRVLVVDDNHLIRRLLTLILEAGGHAPVEAESAEDALELARETPPDAWIVDEVMPGMTGSELVRALRRSSDPRLSCAPVLGISGRAGASTDLLRAGCDAFVAKPIDERRILTALRRVVRGGRGGRRDASAASA
jgi:CheY-like chemotaxis protein